MKLLFDENLSEKIISQISDLFPGSAHVKDFELIRSEDREIWEYAKANNFVLVSKDTDFYQRGILLGPPPKFIYLRVGNSATVEIIRVLRDQRLVIDTFVNNPKEGILVL